MTNLQGGIQVIVTYLAVAVGVKIFQVVFLNRNWRTTLYLSVGLSQLMGLAWILVYWYVRLHILNMKQKKIFEKLTPHTHAHCCRCRDEFGLLDPWFTIFVTVNQALASGISQVLFSMAVIELAKAGQEAITYELIVSVANAGLTVTVVLATQLLTPFDSVTCEQCVFLNGTTTDDDDVPGWLLCSDDDGASAGSCPDNQVNTYSIETYKHTDGPRNFTRYSLVCLGIGLVCLLLFTGFLPRTKAECAQWKAHGESGLFWLSPTMTGIFSFLIAFIMVGYVIAASVALLNPATACLSAFGGSGC